jgi:multidrug efflux pump subunit AcrA (membrane-fusion protein)
VVTAVGVADAIRKEKVISPIAGRVVSLKVLEGSPVRTGDVLLTLRTKEAQATIDGAQALLRSATTDRQKEEARRAEKLADSLQPEILIKASFDGIVASRNITQGEFVADQAELLTLIDVTTIAFMADVPISAVSSIHSGLPARVRFPQLSSHPVSAVVDAISPEADLQSQSIKVRLRFQSLTEVQQLFLKANVPGTAEIITGAHRNVLLTDRSTLLHDDETDEYSIVTMTVDSVARVVPVTVGLQTDSLVEVHSDLLHPGESVIVRGQYALTDSTRVKVESQ